MSGAETITPWRTPDPRTYEERILASSEATLRVLEEIRDELRKPPPVEPNFTPLGSPMKKRK